MAAGTATLAYVREHGLADRAATLGARMLARLRGLAADYPCIGDVRGRGLMIGVELVEPGDERGAGGAPESPTAIQAPIGDLSRACRRWAASRTRPNWRPPSSGSACAAA